MARILVIDDDAQVRAMVTRFLERGGHEVTAAVDGRDGLDALIHNRFAAVVTDIIMPNQEGIETIERIRELDPGMPILAISGSGNDTFSPLDDAKLMGADATLDKPFTVDQLLGAIGKLLEAPRGDAEP